MMIRDLYPSTIREQYACDHWTWYATNGKSAQENYIIQKQKLHKQINEMQAERRATKETKQDDDIWDVKINIKTEVKK